MDEKDCEKITQGELMAAAYKLVELLNSKGHPYMTVIVQQDKVVLTEDLMGIPLPIKD